MDAAMIDVAEQLAQEFPATAPVTVLRILCDCLDQFPSGDPMFIEQATRARLCECCTPGGG